MKIYAISGLGADETVFSLLKLEYPVQHLNWIAPLDQKESIESYAKRIAEPIDESEDYILLGLSFGGLMVVELNKFLQPKKTILLSSAAKRSELKWWFRLIGRLKLLQVIPNVFFRLPRRLLLHMFGTKEKSILYAVLEKMDQDLVKWSVNQLTSWKNTVTPKNTVKISGSKDKLMNSLPDDITSIVPNGEHFMLIDKAKEVSNIINQMVKASINEGV